MLNLKVGNIFTDIEGVIPAELYSKLQRDMAFRPLGYEFSTMYNKWIVDSQGNRVRRMWDGWRRQIWKSKNRKRVFFPTGLLSLVRQSLDKKQVEYQLVNCRVKPEQEMLGLEFAQHFTMRDYQGVVVDDSCSQQRGIIQLPTGSGKTVVAGGIIQKLKVKPFIFFVTSIDLLLQAKESFEEILRDKGKPIIIGQIGGGVIDIRDINVMTVQTAVRSLGEEWDKYKFDSDDQDDKTPIQNKADVLTLLKNAKGCASDEVQHWRAETCQLVTGKLNSAYYRFGLSATPYRDEGDDLMIQACFGKKIAEISASQLIRDNWLIKPSIKIVHVRGEKSAYRQWQQLYKDQITENKNYNTMVSNIANSYIENGRLVLVLVQQIKHGKTLASIIPGSVFLSGDAPKKKRQENIQKLRERKISCIIATSLPYDEVLLVRKNGWIHQIEIGTLCHHHAHEINNREYETLCSVDGLTYVWKTITKTHMHKLQNNIVRVETNQGEDVYVTENHSLVTPELKQIKPSVGGKACVPQGIPSPKDSLQNIDIVKLLSQINDNSLEIEILGITQPIARKLKSEYQYLQDKNSVSKDTQRRVRKRLQNKDKKYKMALTEIFAFFKYYKRRYRAKLSAVKHLDAIFEKFNCRVYIRRSRKNFSLPTSLEVTKDLAVISGLMCGDGHIKHHTNKTCKSLYAFDFAAKKNNTIDGRNDVDKRRIRSIFKQSFSRVFGSVKFSENNRVVKFRGKLIYYLFSKLGHIDVLGKKRVPDYIYNSSPKIQESFLWGLYLSDGSKKINYRSKKRKWSGICIHNTSRSLIIGVQILLQMLNKDYYCSVHHTKHKDMYIITIRSPILHLVPQRIQDRLDYSSSHRIQKIVELADNTSKKLDDIFVYDISVEDSHNFLGGSILCHNTIFDEGIDVRPLDTLLLAGGGKSKVRAMQRIGRIMRPFPGKTVATAIDFRVHQKYLLKHSIAREKMYQTEEEYDIEEIDPDETFK